MTLDELHRYDPRLTVAQLEWVLREAPLRETGVAFVTILRLPEGQRVTVSSLGASLRVWLS